MSMVATGAYAVTPNDSAALPQLARALYVGGAGNVALVPNRGGTAVTFLNVPSGTILPVQAFRVMATSTTATSILALL
jgi:hypothetical protein